MSTTPLLVQLLDWVSARLPTYHSTDRTWAWMAINIAATVQLPSTHMRQNPTIQHNRPTVNLLMRILITVYKSVSRPAHNFNKLFWPLTWDFPQTIHHPTLGEVGLPLLNFPRLFS